NVLDKFEVVKTKNARQNRYKLAGLMPEEMIHQVVDGRRVAHRNLWIDDLNGTYFNAAAALEDGTVLRHIGRLVNLFSTDQKISPDAFLCSGKRSIRDDFIRRAQAFPTPL